ncbi:MAG: NAD(P)(+) transhydrogenase (Re/Si-specific) subunit alpha, partial [Synechococcaceae bacterium WBB_3_034]|nr:NAD(P)(+) transhydrogenase (Re/Si-specific) subunit alpha [Synechococcaceae bacterium WBB_3_034]
MLVPRECCPGETRVAATPETVRRLTAKGCSLSVERGAGQASGYDDDAYRDAGAALVEAKGAGSDHWSHTDVVLAVQAAALVRGRPEFDSLPAGAVLLGLL